MTASLNGSSHAPPVTAPLLKGARKPSPPLRPVDAPKVADPLDGLSHLREVALRGAAILAEGAKPIVYFWSGIAGPDHHVEIAGPSYSGKTGLAVQLACALANPGTTPVRVLGRDVRPVREGDLIVFVEAENGTRSIAELFARTAAMLGLPVAETLDRVLIVPARAGVGAHAVTHANSRSTVWADILELGKKGHVGALFIDSRARVLGLGDAHGEGDQASAQAVIHQAVSLCECPCFVISHTRKTGAETLEDVAGSHQRAAGADVVLLVTADRTAGRIQRTKVVFAKLRDSVSEHPEPVSFTITKSEDGWTLRLTEDGEGDDGEPPYERLRELLSDGGARTKNQIREALKCSGATVLSAITVLRAERRIRETSKRVGGREVEFFSLTPTFQEMGLGGKKRRAAKEAEG